MAVRQMLTDHERAMLDFERQWWRYSGAKEQAIRDLFDVTPTRFFQQLNALIDRPEALAYAPQVVKRLQRVRTKRQRARAQRSASA